MKKAFILLIMSLFLSGCATIRPQASNTCIYVRDILGYDYYSYKDYTVEIITDPPGAKIEINDEYVGTSPLSRTFNGTAGIGLFNNVIIKAYPISPGQYVQTKALGHPVPQKIYFNMNLGPATPEINVNINQQ